MDERAAGARRTTHGLSLVLLVLVLVGGASCATHINIGCIGAIVCRNDPPPKPEPGEKKGKEDTAMTDYTAFTGVARRADGTKYRMRGRVQLIEIAPTPIPPIPTGVIPPPTYRGCFRLDENGVANTALAYGGIAGRRMPNGEVRLYLTANAASGAPEWIESICEVIDPGTYHLDYRQAPIVATRFYTNEYRVCRGTWRQGYPGAFDHFESSMAANGSFLWHEEHQGFYLTFTDGYDVTSSQTHGILFLRLTEDGHTVGFGPWSLTALDGEGRQLVGPRCSGYVTRHPVTGQMIAGGTLISGNANCCWGPGWLSGADFPAPDAPVGETLRIELTERGLWGYFMGPHAVLGTQINQDGTLAPATVVKELHAKWKKKPKSVEDHVRAFFERVKEHDIPGLTSDTYPLRSFRRRIDPPPHEQFDGNAEVGYDPTLRVNVEKYTDAIGPTSSWSDLDFIGGLVPVQIDDKAGYCYFAVVVGPSADGDGHNWYQNVYKPVCPSHGMPAATAITGPVTDSAFPMLIVYDPATIEQVKTGALKDWEAEPAYALNLEVQYPGLRTATITTVGGAKSINAGVFIPETRRMYCVAQRADDTRWQGTGALIHVWGWD